MKILSVKGRVDGSAKTIAIIDDYICVAETGFQILELKKLIGINAAYTTGRMTFVGNLPSVDGDVVFVANHSSYQGIRQVRLDTTMVAASAFWVDITYIPDPLPDGDLYISCVFQDEVKLICVNHLKIAESPILHRTFVANVPEKIETVWLPKDGAYWTYFENAMESRDEYIQLRAELISATPAPPPYAKDVRFLAIITVE